MIVNKKVFLETLGKSDGMLKQYVANGMPTINEPGKNRLYDTALCIDWLMRSQGRKLDYQQERTRLTKANADKAEMDVRIANKELLEFEEVLKEWIARYSQLRSGLQNIPTRAAALLQGVENQVETEAVIDKLLREALDKIEPPKFK